MSAWVASNGLTAPGSCVNYFTRRVRRNKPFSPRLWRQFIRAIERIYSNELKGWNLRLFACRTVSMLVCIIWKTKANGHGC